MISHMLQPHLHEVSQMHDPGFQGRVMRARHTLGMKEMPVHYLIY
jgi:hypothetical protein